MLLRKVTTLTIGDETDFKVFLGWKGQGPASFCTTLGHILPEHEVVQTMLEYTDNKGVLKTVEGEFSKRC